MRPAFVVALLLASGIARAQDPCDACLEPTPPPSRYPPPPVVPIPEASPALPAQETQDERTLKLLVQGASGMLAAGAPRPRTNVLLRYELGAVYTHALERNLGGARFDFEAGGEGEHFTIGGRIGAEAGGTESGLPYQRMSWGFGVDGKIGRVRLGLEPRLGFITIIRASDRNPLEDLSALTAGLHGECLVALIGPGEPSKRRGGGLDLIMRAGYDWIDVTNGRLDASNTVAVKLGLGGRY